MEKEYKYEFIVDGIVIDRITVDSREELKKCIDTLKETEERYRTILIEDSISTKEELICPNCREKIYVRKAHMDSEGYYKCKRVDSTNSAPNSQETKPERFVVEAGKQNETVKGDKTPDTIHQQNKKLLDKDYAKTNKEVRT